MRIKKGKRLFTDFFRQSQAIEFSLHLLEAPCIDLKDFVLFTWSATKIRTGASSTPVSASKYFFESSARDFLKTSNEIILKFQ